MKKFGDNYDAIFGRKDPVKKNMDKFHKPSTHIDKKKEEKKNPKFRKTLWEIR
jgi:hypothetical protein